MDKLVSVESVKLRSASEITDREILLEATARLNDRLLADWLNTLSDTKLGLLHNTIGAGIEGINDVSDSDRVFAAVMKYVYADEFDAEQEALEKIKAITDPAHETIH